MQIDCDRGLPVLETSTDTANDKFSARTTLNRMRRSDQYLDTFINDLSDRVANMSNENSKLHALAITPLTHRKLFTCSNLVRFPLRLPFTVAKPAVPFHTAYAGDEISGT